MENFLENIAPEGQAWYAHTLEGRDDSPAHLRAMITNTSLDIPIDNGALSLGHLAGRLCCRTPQGRLPAAGTAKSAFHRITFEASSKKRLKRHPLSHDSKI